MNPATLIAELWALMGPSLRRGVLTVVGTAAVLVLVMFAYLAYSTGEVYRRTGMLPTREDVREQTEEITSTMATQEDVERVAAGLSMYRDSLQRLRKHLDTTLVDPGLRAVVDLQKRMAKLESGQLMTNLAIEESRRQGDRTTEQLIDQMNRQSSEEERNKMDAENMLREVLKELKSVRSDNEHIKKKLKIDTKTF